MNPLLELSNYFYTFPAWPPLVVGVCSLTLGLVILARERGSYASRTFAALCACVALWLLAIAGLYSAKDPEFSLLMARVAATAVALIPSVLLTFTIVIVRQFDRFKWISRSALVISGVIGGFLMRGDRLISGLRTYPWGPYPEVRSASVLCLVFCLLLYAATLFLLYRQSFSGRRLNFNRDRDRQIWLAFAVGGLACVDFFACYGFEVYPIGYLPVYTGLLILAQTIWKYRFSALTAAFAAPHIIRTMPAGLIVADSDGQIVIANDQSAEILRRPVAELRSTTLQSLLGDLFSPAELSRLIEENQLRDYEVVIGDLDAGGRVLSLSAAMIRREAAGPAAGFVLTIQDVTQRRLAESERVQAQVRLASAYADLEERVKQRTAALTEEIRRRETAEEALKALAVTDPLTELYNRRGFWTQGKNNLELSRREGRPFLMLIADLDNLKPVNDTYGHQIGDQVLVETAALLRKTLRPDDVVARIGGDEFAIGIIETGDYTEQIFLNRLQSGLDQLNATHAGSYRVGLSVGIARAEAHQARTLDQLLAEADAALYQQKKMKPRRSPSPEGAR